MKRLLTALVPVVLLLTACGGDSTDGAAPAEAAGVVPEVAGAFPAAAGTVAISGTGDTDPAEPREPLPIGTTFTFDGWTATLIKAEHSTQDSGSPTNPRAAVIQAELEVTAPEQSEADYTDRPAFTVQARTNGSDMVPCGTDDPYSAFEPGETRILTTCVAYSGDDAVAQQTPTVSVVALFGGFDQTASLEVQTTRGPDY